MTTTLAASSFLPSFLDPEYLVGLGVVVLLLIVFAETGLLIGFFLPGDSLLFLAGVFAAAGELNTAAVLVGVPIAAFLGAQTGWWIGRKAGPMLFDRPESRLFKRSNVERAEAYLDKFGEGKAIVLARFIPIVRTFMNPVAGVLEVPARKFLLYNAVGAVAWGFGVPLAGYAVGEAVSVDKYIIPATLVIIVISVIPVALEIRKARREGREQRFVEEHAARLREEDSPLGG